MNEAAPRRSRRARLSPLTVFGELLIVAGLAVFGYIVWQPWHTAVVVTGQQLELTTKHSQQWDAQATEPYDGEVPVREAPTAQGDVFGTLHVPAFGTTFANFIGEGVDPWKTLNLPEVGIGRYSEGAMPGGVGNFAVAAHRSGGYTTPFKEVMNLRVGDPLFVETADGWYTYRFRSLEFVWPNEGAVLNPFPRSDTAEPTDRIMTLTTCHPKNWGTDERAIAYSVFESFQPRADGPPAELIELNPAITGGNA